MTDKSPVTPKAISRRDLLKHTGKAAYVATALMVLNLIPGTTQAQLPSGCHPFPDPNDPACQNATGPTPSNVKPKKPRKG